MARIDSFIDLKWRNFQKNIPQTFEDVRASQDFCDVTLACEDEGLVEAHRIILASGSIFFQKLLSSGRLGPNPHPLLYLKGVRSWQLDAVMDFLYSGETRVRQKELDSFLELAQQLGIIGLMREQPYWLQESVLTNWSNNHSLPNIITKPLNEEIDRYFDEQVCVSKHADNTKKITPEENGVDEVKQRKYLEDKTRVNSGDESLLVDMSIPVPTPSPTPREYPLPPVPLSQMSKDELDEFCRKMLNHCLPKTLVRGHGSLALWEERFPVSSLSPRSRALLEGDTVALADIRSWNPGMALGQKFKQGPGPQDLEWRKPMPWNKFMILMTEILCLKSGSDPEVSLDPSTDKHTSLELPNIYDSDHGFL
jgi:hypothetical protein